MRPFVGALPGVSVVRKVWDSGGRGHGRCAHQPDTGGRDQSSGLLHGEGHRDPVYHRPGGARRYYSFGPAMLKISEFSIPAGFAKADLPLSSDEMRLKKGVIVGAIARNGGTIIPKGDDVIRPGDRVFVLSERPLDIFS